MPAIRTVVGFILMLHLYSGVVSAENEITFISTDTPPFWSPELPGDGWAGSMLQLMSEAAGVNYRIRYLPVKRFHLSKEPFIVGDPGILKYFEHRTVFPILVFRSAFFTYSPAQQQSSSLSLSQLQGQTLGVLRGTMEDKAAFLEKGIRVEESDSVESLLRKLKGGRIDHAIMLHEAGLHLVRKLFPESEEAFVSTAIRGTERPIAIMIDPDHPEGEEIAKRYQSVLEKVLNSPVYKSRLEQHFGTGNIPSTIYDELNSFVQFYSDTWEE